MLKAIARAEAQLRLASELGAQLESIRSRTLHTAEHLRDVLHQASRETL